MRNSEIKFNAALCALLAAAMLFSLASAVFAADSPAQWAEEEINSSLLNSYVSSSENADFSAPVTKKELARMLLAAYLMSGGSFEISVSNPFSDVTDPFLLTAAGLGLASGETETEFAPEKELTRLEALKLVYSAAEKIYGYTAEDAESFSQYVDSVHDYTDIADAEAEKAAVGFALACWVVVGTEEALLDLNSPCTVEQALVFVSRGIIDE